MKLVRTLLPVVLLFFAATAFTSCQGTMPTEKVYVCDDCGHVKGGADCCEEDAATCDKCGLVEGSPGCCKIEKGKGDVEWCAACNVPMKAGCCDAKGEKCTDCGEAKGSKSCCADKKK